MTEQEYIDVTDLAKVNMVQKILTEIVPTISSVMQPEEYKAVMAMIDKWRTDLFALVVTSE